MKGSEALDLGLKYINDLQEENARLKSIKIFADQMADELESKIIKIVTDADTFEPCDCSFCSVVNLYREACK